MHDSRRDSPRDFFLRRILAEHIFFNKHAVLALEYLLGRLLFHNIKPDLKKIYYLFTCIYT